VSLVEKWSGALMFNEKLSAREIVVFVAEIMQIKNKKNLNFDFIAAHTTKDLK
jgi:hypothetical protein